jgi:DNA-binding transcriptional LysR family regulator
MELRHLRYFVSVAEELNFTRAAARLRVAQPALSRQIRALEEELETPLFERTRLGARLTRAGRVFFPRARAILGDADEAANEARTASGVISGRLSLGFPTGLHLNYLAPVLEALRRAHPRVDLDYVHALPPEQLKALRDGTLDVGFVTYPARLDGFDHRVIWRVPYKVVLPARHPLARKSSFNLRDLRDQDFVFCPREARPELYDELFRQCANAGFRPRVVKEVGGYPTSMLGLVSVGVGLAVLPHFERAERMRGIVWRPLLKPRIAAQFALVWRPDHISRVGEELIAFAMRHFPAGAGDVVSR